MKIEQKRRLCHFEKWTSVKLGMESHRMCSSATLLFVLRYLVKSFGKTYHISL